MNAEGSVVDRKVIFGAVVKVESERDRVALTERKRVNIKGLMCWVSCICVRQGSFYRILAYHYPPIKTSGR